MQVWMTLSDLTTVVGLPIQGGHWSASQSPLLFTGYGP